MPQKNTLYWEMLPCGLTMAKWLDVSTCHITEQDNQLLGSDCDASQTTAIASRKGGGYFVHVFHDDIEENEQELLQVGYSREFIRLIQIARAEGASWICLHSDGPDTDFLPAFTW